MLVRQQRAEGLVGNSWLTGDRGEGGGKRWTGKGTRDRGTEREQEVGERGVKWEMREAVPQHSAFLYFLLAGVA